jgi:hypothetical protein
MLIDFISIQNEVTEKIGTESKLDNLEVAPPLGESVDCDASLP